MKTEVYTYSLLQYHHSQVLGEVLNIGLLVYFKNKNEFRFLYPEKLIRLRFAYPNVPEKTIKAYYRTFQDRVNKLNHQQELYSPIDISESLSKLIDSEFLPSDSSALQFSKSKKAISYTNDVEKISNQLYNLYFTVFEQDDTTTNRVLEIDLLNKYKSFLQFYEHHSTPKIPNTIIYDYEVKFTDTKYFKSEIAWKNGTITNLVKPISFDLIKPENLTSKAYRYFGQFTDLDSYAINNNYRFDILLGKPKNKDLFVRYDDAIKLLQQPKSVKLIEENEIRKYSEVTIRQSNFVE